MRSRGARRYQRTMVEPFALGIKGMALTELQSDSEEYRQIAERFYVDRGYTRIEDIYRVRNPTLLQRYTRRKQLMRMANPGSEMREEGMFHGTPRDNAVSICSRGFNLPDRPHCFGFSICFAESSTIAEIYTNCTPLPVFKPVATPAWPPRGSILPGPGLPCLHDMLLCDVLVGATVGLTTAREKGYDYARIDSIEGDDWRHGRTLGVLSPDQALPRYLLTFNPFCVPWGSPYESYHQAMAHALMNAHPWAPVRLKIGGQKRTDPHRALQGQNPRWHR